MSDPTRDDAAPAAGEGGDVGRRGEGVGPPPWIVGHRGTPLEAPENTLASLRRAVELGLDGVEYDVRACATGELVLLHDATLERTSDGHGALSEHTLPELAGIDAGSWFGREFRGEPLPLLGEALALEVAPGQEPPLHMIELKEPGLVGEVARELAGTRALPVRVASFRRDTCLEARDAGLAAMLLSDRATEEDRRFVRDERLAAYSVGPGGWSAELAAAEWSCERWAWSLDDPREMHRLCRLPLFGFNTNEPLRALALRALVRLTPDDEGPYPLAVPELVVEPESALVSSRGEWCGRWEPEIGLRNPFPFPVRVVLDLLVRRGAFEVEGLPVGASLAPGTSLRHRFRLVGGSWRVGGDPVVAATFVWERGPGRAPGRLTLDASLERVRELRLRADSMRLFLLKERPGDPDATLSVRRRGRELLVSIENPGGLEEARTVVSLDGRTHRGSTGVRVPLPEDFDRRPGGVRFSAGVLGRRDGEWRVRRWSGGVPGGLGAGAPGRLVPKGTA